MPKWTGTVGIVLMAAALLGCGGVEVEQVVQPHDVRPSDLVEPEGTAIALCRVGPGRRPQACSILSATPDSPEVRALALAGAARFDLSDPRLPQPPVGQMIRFRVVVHIR